MAAPAAVIPLQSKETHADQVAADAEWPEPVQLYGLTALAFVLHVERDGMCVMCPEAWPCAHLRLAYRLREGF